MPRADVALPDPLQVLLLAWGDVSGFWVLPCAPASSCYPNPSKLSQLCCHTRFLGALPTEVL